jgi:hypothetical protein
VNNVWILIALPEESDDIQTGLTTRDTQRWGGEFSHHQGIFYAEGNIGCLLGEKGGTNIVRAGWGVTRRGRDAPEAR